MIRLFKRWTLDGVTNSYASDLAWRSMFGGLGGLLDYFN